MILREYQVLELKEILDGQEVDVKSDLKFTNTIMVYINIFLRTLPKLCIQYNKSRALSIGLVNIRSFNNKIDQFIHHFKSLDLDVCCVTESWIKNCELTILDDLNSVGLSLINIPRKDRTGGGISIISSSRLSSKTLRSDEHKSFEYGIFSVKCHGKELIFVIIYRPPYSSNHRVTTSTFFIEFPDFIADCLRDFQNVIITDDFNIPWNKIDDIDTVSLTEVTELYGLKQHVHLPTHISGNTIDLMLTPEESSLRLSDVTSSYYISDHSFVSAKLSIEKPPLIRKKNQC